jgi:molybdopterin converting factor small subunit
MPTVKIPPPYRGPTGGLEAIEVAGATVRQCIEAVDAAHPGFAGQVFDGGGEPHRFVKLFVNGEQAPPDASVGAGDEVEVLAAIAGG